MRGLAPISKEIGNFGENVARRAGLENQHGRSQPSTGSRLLAFVFIYDYIICDCKSNCIICYCIFDYIICDCIYLNPSLRIVYLILRFLFVLELILIPFPFFTGIYFNSSPNRIQNCENVQKLYNYIVS